MDADRFRAALAECQGSPWWELLAASAGAPGAVDHVMTGLTRKELDRAAHGLAIAPSVVAERVEALVAFSPSKLAEVAAEWRPVDDDPFWSAAWRTAARHLGAEPVAAHSDGGGVERSWNELVGEYRSRYTPFDRVRGWAGSSLADTSIGVMQVESAPLLVLRVLRGREHLLDQEARGYLLAVADDALKLDPFESALLLEIASTFDGRAAMKVRDDVIAELPVLTDPRTVIPLAYVLTGRGWTVP